MHTKHTGTQTISMHGTRCAWGNSTRTSEQVGEERPSPTKEHMNQSTQRAWCTHIHTVGQSSLDITRERKAQETFEAGCSMNGQGPSATKGHRVCTEKVPRRRRKSLRSAGTVLAASSAWVHTRDHGGQCSLLLACLGERGDYMEKQEACTCFSAQHHRRQWSLKKNVGHDDATSSCLHMVCARKMRKKCHV